MTTVDPLTIGHIGLGATLRARMGNAGMGMLVKFIEFAGHAASVPAPRVP